ncbi:MAG: type II toxin-antitoxin system VapC family toxin [Nanoarchaeota archaeon]
MMKNYLDTNIFMNAFLYEDDKAKKCKEIISKIARNELVGVTSALTWDEIVYSIKRLLGSEKAEISGERFLNIPNLKLLSADKNIIARSQKLIVKYKLNPRDAIHAATAMLNGCNSIISDDSDFDKVKEIKRVKV